MWGRECIFTIKPQIFPSKLKDFSPKLKDFLPKLKNFLVKNYNYTQNFTNFTQKSGKSICWWRTNNGEKGCTSTWRNPFCWILPLSGCPRRPRLRRRNKLLSSAEDCSSPLVSCATDRQLHWDLKMLAVLIEEESCYDHSINKSLTTWYFIRR